MKRSQISDNYKWDLSSYCKNDSEFVSRVDLLKNYQEKISSFEGRLSNDDCLFDALDLDSKLMLEIEPLLNYAARKRDENLANSENSELVALIIKVNTDLSVAGAYMLPEICAFSKEKLTSLINNPRFRRFRLTFKSALRNKPHVLDKERSALITGMGDFLGGFSESYDNFADADLKFNDIIDSKGKKHKFTAAKYSLFMRSKDRQLRKSAFTEQNSAYGRNINFLTSLYLSDVKSECYFAKIHNYPSALSCSIHQEEASEKVYFKLIDQVHKHLPILYKFYAKKAKILGYDKFYIYDQMAPIGKNLTKKYSFEASLDLIKQALAPLGEEYVKLLDKAKEERWMDVYPNDGKASGAYSSGAFGHHPLVLLNHTDDLNSVSTMAHELGHAIHSYLSNQHQIFEESEYVIFVAEVASTVNEMLLKMMLLNNSNSLSEKRAIIDEIFSDVKSTIFRQTMFAEFEAWVHEEIEKGRTLSKDKLCDKYLELNKLYFGHKVKLDDAVKYEWARIPHFYRHFYVYKYATGLISAINIVSRILNGENGAVEKYIDFLSSGCTSDPITLLKNAGVDLESDETFEKVFSFLNELLKNFNYIY